MKTPEFYKNIEEYKPKVVVDCEPKGKILPFQNKHSLTISPELIMEIEARVKSGAN